MCGHLLNIGILASRSEGKKAAARYRRGVPPTLAAAMGLAARAVAREPWLVPVGALVAGVRRAATWPAWAVLLAIAVAGARSGLHARPFDPTAALDGALAAIGAPRTVFLVAGIWLAGALVAGALRVAWLAGALPTLGGAMAGETSPVFARGVAYAFPRVLVTAALALVAELAATLFTMGVVVAAVLVSAHAIASGGSGLLAAAVALALTVAIAVPVAVGALGDAAVARASLRAEGPARAFAESTLRLLARPGAFVLGALSFGLAGWLAPIAVEATGGVVTGFARGVDPIVLLGPNLMLALAALLVAAAVDLLWLATVSALACGTGRR
jgi:hypothetical protein